MLSRRVLLAAAAQLGVAGALVRLDVAEVFAQAAQDWGKGKLIRRSLRPPDYETPVSMLDSFITPNELFYVRSHLPVPPSLDAAMWTLKVDGEVTTPLTLTLDELRKLP